MAEIGVMLREARMRAHLDVAELEARTKIRAKYLRALENEEWDLLPGSTFIKSFLRTYGDALGLDSRLLVEEYKLRHERLSDMEMQPIVPPGASRRARPPVRRVPRWAVIGLVLAGLVATLAVLGSRGSSPRTTSTPIATGPVPPTLTRGAPKAAGGTRGTHHRRSVTLKLVPTAPVYVCLVAAGGRRLINGSTLTPGSPSATFTGASFRLTLGNGSVKLFVDGRSRPVPAAATGIGYEITPRGRAPLARGHRPTCA